MVIMSLIIKIQDDTKEALEKLRTHPRETWDDLIKKCLEMKK
jgi:hypothetical protein